jgi:hypothetical protein
MTYTKSFFELQFDFATKIAEASGSPIEDVMLNYTAFYKIFGTHDWDFNATNPIWVSFLEQFQKSDDKIATIYDFYLNITRDEEKEEHVFGCFSYHYEEKEKYIQLHFKNNETDGIGPLSDEQMPIRRSELKSLFADAFATYPQAETVVGFSWLYNLDAYKRLFPVEHIASAKVVPDWYKSLALWGQFFDKDGNLKEEMVQAFRTCSTHKNTVEELTACFQFQVLELQTGVAIFKNYY